MHALPLPGCCAGLVFFDLDNEYQKQRHVPYEPNNLEKMEEEMRKAIILNGSCIIVATTNQNQIDGETVLKKVGFKMVEEQFGPSSHGNHIHLWYYKS